ncbi:MAG: hypothetical protein EXQ97_07970 [Alphaproteobacteria bacterium]|nr:hypothetical protein [Alphaproteobacteria bacterium]
MAPTGTDLQKWLNTVSTYDNEFKKWEARTTKIVRRYRDDNRSMTNNEATKFNILCSNVQTFTPVVYARLPKDDVSRRFADTDPVGRVAAQLIEASDRAGAYRAGTVDLHRCRSPCRPAGGRITAGRTGTTAKCGNQG